MFLHHLTPTSAYFSLKLLVSKDQIYSYDIYTSLTVFLISGKSLFQIILMCFLLFIVEKMIFICSALALVFSLVSFVLFSYLPL